MSETVKEKISKPIEPGRLIRLLRVARGFSQEDLAFEIGSSRSYLSMVECGGKAPGLLWLKKVAKFFDMPVTMLIPDEAQDHVILRRMIANTLIMVLEQKAEEKDQ